MQTARLMTLQGRHKEATFVLFLGDIKVSLEDDIRNGQCMNFSMDMGVSLTSREDKIKNERAKYQNTGKSQRMCTGGILHSYPNSSLHNPLTTSA